MVTSCYEAKSQVTESLKHGLRTECPRCCHQPALPMNQHTYSMLKDICREFLKEISNEKRKVVYSVFNGGNSMNTEYIRKRASQCDKLSKPASNASVCFSKPLSKTENPSSQLCMGLKFDGESRDGPSRRSTGVGTRKIKSKIAGPARWYN